MCNHLGLVQLQVKLNGIQRTRICPERCENLAVAGLGDPHHPQLFAEPDGLHPIPPRRLDRLIVFPASGLHLQSRASADRVIRQRPEHSRTIRVVRGLVACTRADLAPDVRVEFAVRPQ